MVPEHGLRPWGQVFSTSTRKIIISARHVLRGLAIVAPPCTYEHNARETARRAHHDAFGNDRGAPWRDPTEGGG